MQIPAQAPTRSPVLGRIHRVRDSAAQPAPPVTEYLRMHTAFVACRPTPVAASASAGRPGRARRSLAVKTPQLSAQDALQVTVAAPRRLLKPAQDLKLTPSNGKTLTVRPQHPLVAHPRIRLSLRVCIHLTLQLLDALLQKPCLELLPPDICSVHLRQRLPATCTNGHFLSACYLTGSRAQPQELPGRGGASIIWQVNSNVTVTPSVTSIRPGTPGSGTS